MHSDDIAVGGVERDSKVAPDEAAPDAGVSIVAVIVTP
jgi:hypothetical protein